MVNSEGLIEFLESKARDRNTYKQKLGWSKWTITNKGEENDGYIRFFNTKSVSMETAKQLVFYKDGKYRALVGNDEGDVKFIPYSFDCQIEAKNILTKFTFLDWFFGQPFFDCQRYNAYYRCKETIDPEDDMMMHDFERWVSEELCPSDDATPMTSHENGEAIASFYKMFIE